MSAITMLAVAIYVREVLELVRTTRCVMEPSGAMCLGADVESCDGSQCKLSWHTLAKSRTVASQPEHGANGPQGHRARCLRFARDVGGCGDRE